MYICLAFAPGSLLSAAMSTCMNICLAFAPGSLLSAVMSTCMYKCLAFAPSLLSAVISTLYIYIFLVFLLLSLLWNSQVFAFFSMIAVIVLVVWLALTLALNWGNRNPRRKLMFKVTTV